jgi:arylformamidase
MTVPLVYRDYDQEALDAQYNNRKRFPDYIDRFKAWTEWSAATRGKLKSHLDVAFGDGAKEKLDIVPAPGRGAPVYVFVHGGYWYSLDKSDFSYVAAGMVPHGVMTVVNNYALAPAVDMDAIVRQNRAAMAWLYRHAADYGGDPNRIYACGHSAGGHLVCMMLATDWPAFSPGLPKEVVKGACAVSGLFDLEPIRRSYLNETLCMTPEMAARNSPLRQTYPTQAPLLLVLGADESEEYHRQTDIMAAFWRAHDGPTEVIVPENLDHFSIVDSLLDPNADLVQKQLARFPG